MSNPNSLPKECVLERIQTMMLQEQTSYRYESYFPPMSLNDFERVSKMNTGWREKICQWSYNVVDHFDLPREVVAVSLNLFDRYLATQANQCSGNLALLASLTTLHIAIKVHSEKNVKISTLASLSRGQFGANDIEKMEWQIFSALKWRLHPPTLFALVSHLLMIFSDDVHHSVKKELFEIAIYVAELSVCDSYFVKFPASVVALAAIMNVIDDMPEHKLTQRDRTMFWTDVTLHLRGLAYSTKLQAARGRLRAMFGSNTTLQEQTIITTSPTSTTDMQVDESASLSSLSLNNVSTTSYFQEPMSRTDSKESFRYSPSPTSRRTDIVTSMVTSPMIGRLRIVSSPIVASIQ